MKACTTTAVLLTPININNRPLTVIIKPERMAFTYLPVRVANQIFALQVLTVVFIENSYHEMRHHAL